MKRSKYEIIAEILRRCSRGVNSTRLMHELGFSWSEMRKYVLFLISKGYLKVSREQREDSAGFSRKMDMYYRTETGLVLLMAFDNLETMLSDSPKMPIATV